MTTFDITPLMKLSIALWFRPSAKIKSAIAMASARCFEFAFIENIFDQASVNECLENPRSWNAIAFGSFSQEIFDKACFDISNGERNASKDDEVWIEEDLVAFCLDLDGRGRFVQCYLEGRLSNDALCFTFRENAPARTPSLQPEYCHRKNRVVIREVPATLILTCSMSKIAEDNFEGKITALSGGLVAHIRDGIVPSQKCDLTIRAAVAAAHQGRLQSQNQRVCLLLEGQTIPLGEEMVPAFARNLIKARSA